MDELHLHPHQAMISRADRQRIKGHQPAVLWFTGLSGSGKSTIANLVEYQLNQVHLAHTTLLDGDTVRTGLNKDLTFTEEDRQENIRRIGEVCRLFNQAGLLVLTAFISPLRADRDQIRALLPSGEFLEIFVDCPLEICEQRDPKGLYQKARAGIITNFTGIDAAYEPPQHPEIHLLSAEMTPEECAQVVIDYLCEKNIIRHIDKPKQ
jgi:adenylylsulfate kinase